LIPWWDGFEKLETDLEEPSMKTIPETVPTIKT